MSFKTLSTTIATTAQAARFKSLVPPEQLLRRDAILDFWFGKTWSDKAITPNFELWFGGTPEIDKSIVDNFAEDVILARDGKLRHWMTESAFSCLALIILLDQFALNVFRDKPEGYQVSELAIPITYTAIARGYDKELGNDFFKMFMFLPLEHSELMQDQEKSMEMFATCESTDLLGYAKEHRDVVEKYGRFPGRNICMGRESRPDEIEYLKNGGVF